MISQEIRALIISHLREGRKVSEIVPLFSDHCKRTTIFKVAKEFRSGVQEEAKKAQKHPWRKIDPKMAATVIRRLTKAKSSHSMRSVGRDLGIAVESVRNILKRKGMKCFKKKKRNLIPEAQQDSRKKCCVKFRKTFRKKDVKNLLFVDECYVTVQKSFNAQNERCFGLSFDAIPDCKKYKQSPKTPLCAMIFGGVFRDGRTPLVVLKSGFRLNQQTYKKECLDHVKKYLPDHLSADTVIFYQDKAPCHAAASVQSHLAAIFPCFISNDRMPPNSPDLNVLDFCVWALLKERLNKYGMIPN